MHYHFCTSVTRKYFRFVFVCLRFAIACLEDKFPMSGSGLSVGSLFITGANRGIGLEFVKQLSQLPQPPKHIFATCRKPDAAEVLYISSPQVGGVYCFNALHLCTPLAVANTNEPALHFLM